MLKAFAYVTLALLIGYFNSHYNNWLILSEFCFLVLAIINFVKANKGLK